MFIFVRIAIQINLQESHSFHTERTNPDCIHMVMFSHALSYERQFQDSIRGAIASVAVLGCTQGEVASSRMTCRDTAEVSYVHAANASGNITVKRPEMQRLSSYLSLHRLFFRAFS